MNTIGKYKYGRKGFTLIEIIIVLVVIATLAAILTPTLMNYIEDSKVARASKDVSIIAAAVAQLNKDTNAWPVYTDITAKDGEIDCLYTGPETLDSGDFTGSNPPLTFDGAFDHLMRNEANYPSTGSNIWRGPYISKDTADPWGTPYAILVNRFKGTTGVYAWVLSAGPDGVFETDEALVEIPADSDDIGILMQ